MPSQRESSSTPCSLDLLPLCYIRTYRQIAASRGYTYVPDLLNAIAAYILSFVSGLQLLTQVIVADMTTLRWRSFMAAMTSLPFVVNAWIGANIANDILEQSGWRWGCKHLVDFIQARQCVTAFFFDIPDGMFAILVPATLLPLISILFWGERKAKRLGIVDQELAANGVPKEALVFGEQ